MKHLEILRVRYELCKVITIKIKNFHQTLINVGSFFWSGTGKVSERTVFQSVLEPVCIFYLLLELDIHSYFSGQCRFLEEKDLE
jgi:hypothetical protein